MKLSQLLWVMILLPNIAGATVYENTEVNHQTTYSDIPLTPQAKVIDPDISDASLSITSIDNVSQKKAAEDKKDKEALSLIPYQSFAIESPKDQETIQNQPSFSVRINIKPDLRNNEKIQLYIDNKPWQSPTSSLQLNVSTLARGTHSLYASVIDANGKTMLQSGSITIYVHQAHLGSP